VSGRVVVGVTDNGPGITAEHLGKIFFPFYTTKPAGPGIGLSLCRGIMRTHRGTILARSESDAETVFTLKF
jgi:signal transduction histidine kinase